MVTRKPLGIPRWVLAGLLACGLLCGAGGAGLLWALDRMLDRLVTEQVAGPLRRDVEEALAAMVVFLDFEALLREGDVEAAYALTSEDFRRRHTPEAFAGLVGRHPELRAPWVVSSSEARGGNAISYRVQAGPGGTAPAEFRLGLRKERGAWTVHDIVFP